jgi:putative hydrolase of the HAD superfamily
MVKAVVTDYDGVIRHWRNDKIYSIERRCKLAKGSLLGHCFEQDIAHDALVGRITYDQWLLKIHVAIKARYGRAIAEHTTEAFRTERGLVDHGLIDYFRQLFPNAKLALATNATNRLPLELKEAQLSTCFDFVFNSSAMGVAKPERGFYYGLLITMGLSPKDVIFIDDSYENVATAKSAGMIALQCQSRSQLINELTDLALQHSVLA